LEYQPKNTEAAPMIPPITRIYTSRVSVRLKFAVNVPNLDTSRVIGLAGFAVLIILQA
jgi:hypothetical protein